MKEDLVPASFKPKSGTDEGDAAGQRADSPTPRRRRSKRGAWLASGLERFSGIYLLVLSIIIFTTLRPDTFATERNVRFIIANEAIGALVALALILPLTAATFDISVAAMMGLAVVLVGWLQLNGVGTVPAILLTLACGALVGAMNALIIVRLKVTPFIATLGTSSVLSALAYWLAGGEDIFSGLSSSYKQLGQADPFGIPMPVFYMVLVALILYYVLEHMPLGRYARALGGNSDAARLAGLRVNRLRTIMLLSSALIATFAGLVFAARLGTAPLNAGDPYLLPSYAAVFLGSTQLRPGRFNVGGTLVAVYLLATGVNGLSLLYPNNPWFDQFFSGAVLIVAVALSLRKRKTELEDDEQRTYEAAGFGGTS